MTICLEKHGYNWLYLLTGVGLLHISLVFVLHKDSSYIRIVPYVFKLLNI
jgi:hypothetical protein